MVAGQIQQLQSADSIAISSITVGTVIQQTNDEVAPIVICTVVYSDANDGIKKAKADASGTKDVIGLVRDASITNAVAGGIIVDGVHTATTGQWDAVFGTTGGLTKGTRYYLSAATAGLATSAATSTAGQYVVELGIALSTTELNINVRSPVLL